MTFKHFLVEDLGKKTPQAKTSRYRISSNVGTPLGLIEYHPPWRKYVFVPQPSTIWDLDCLADVRAAIQAVSR
jgi:hypothetical protein